jgi:hypothetical protein
LAENGAQSSLVVTGAFSEETGLNRSFTWS